MESLSAGGLEIPVRRFRAVVVGSGAAGLNCAEHLHELGVTDVAIITSRLGGGTSANSGSDKQTYYKLGVFGDVPDSPMEFARTLTAGGMCHGDLAFIEALGSLPEFYHLVRNGVEFPHNAYGAYVGYKTDHDPRQRATSAGPKTSMQMVARSLENVRRNGTPVFDGYEVVRLLTAGESGVRGQESGTAGTATAGAGRMPAVRGEAVVGVLAVEKARVGEEGHGLCVFLAEHVILATGGPGELYRDSVYPPGQVGSHGLALEVGCRANNLTESQFGLASVGFRWNLSGTYQQVIPCYLSTDERGGDVRYFLNDYYETMRQEATCIFLKGYQWPFHAERLQGYGSSLIDFCVEGEREAGRRVFMDFTRNPVATEGLAEFSLEDLEPEAREYLERSGALQATPYERLEHMNPDAIAIYSEHGVDLREPLEVAVCAQHCNGGLTVDGWWRTSVPGLFAIGEVAGTHGVRPGGSALNGGQVGGLRAAQWIAWRESGVGSQESGTATARRLKPAATTAALQEQVAQEVGEIRGYLAPGEAALSIGEVRRQIQTRMSEAAGFVRSLAGARQALAEAEALAARLAEVGQRVKRPEQLVAAMENEHLCRTHVAFLTALVALLERGGGSRGAYAVLDGSGERRVQTRRGLVFPHRGENLSMRQEVLEVEASEAGGFCVGVTPVRPLPEDSSWYENTWREWRRGAVFTRAGGRDGRDESESIGRQ